MTEIGLFPPAKASCKAGFVNKSVPVLSTPLPPPPTTDPYNPLLPISDANTVGLRPALLTQPCGSAAFRKQEKTSLACLLLHPHSHTDATLSL